MELGVYAVFWRGTAYEGGGSRVGQKHPLGHDVHLTFMKEKGRARQGELKKMTEILSSLC